jgi:hypothetical protein
MIRAGLSLPALMQLMGRAQIQITLAYLQITPQDVVSLAISVIFGVIPALQISRPEPMEVLRDSSRSTTAGGAEREGWSAEWYPGQFRLFPHAQNIFNSRPGIYNGRFRHRPPGGDHQCRHGAALLPQRGCARKTIYIGS